MPWRWSRKIWNKCSLRQGLLRELRSTVAYHVYVFQRRQSRSNGSHIKYRTYYPVLASNQSLPFYSQGTKHFCVLESSLSASCSWLQYTGYTDDPLLKCHSCCSTFYFHSLSAATTSMALSTLIVWP